MNKEYKTFLLEGAFHTDGDYYLDLNNLELKENYFDKYFNFIHEKYVFSMQTDDIYKIRDFLENLIVIYRVGRGHYWVLRNLYDMTKKVLDVVFNDDIEDIYESIGGNYDGTFISLTKLNRTVANESTNAASLFCRKDGEAQNEI